MASRVSLRSPQIIALLSLAVSLLAMTQVQTTFSLNSFSTYDATSSITVFRNAIIVTAAFYGLSFLTRWLVLPGMVTGLFSGLATGTFLLGPGRAAGSSSRTALAIAMLGVLVALWEGVLIMRRRRSSPAAA